MLALIVTEPRPISPFGEPASRSWCLSATLGQLMAARLERAGLGIEVVPSFAAAEQRARGEPEGAVVVSDAVAASALVLRRFVAECVRRAGSAGPTALRCALPRAHATDLLSHVGGLEQIRATDGTAAWTAPLFFLRGGATIARAEPVLLPYREFVWKVKLPSVRDATEQPVGVTESYLCEVKHWVHVLRVNHAEIMHDWFARLRRGWWSAGVGWLGFRALLGFPWVGGRLHGALHRTSWRARVHHRATLGWSVVRSGAVVEAGAILDCAYVCEGAIVEAGAHVIGSVIGPGASVGRRATVVGSVVYPNAFAGQRLMQLSILGAGAAAMASSNFFDLNLERNVRVMHEGRPTDCGLRGLGVAVGPGARIAGGVWVASGREVPAGIVLVKDMREVAQSFEDLEPGSFATVRDGVARAPNG